MKDPVAEPSIENSVTTSLLDFICYARNKRFFVGVQESLDCQKLALEIDVTQKQQLKQGLKSLLCQSSTDWDRFDELFDTYWQPLRKRQQAVSSMGGQAPKSQSVTAFGQGSGTDLDFADPLMISEPAGQQQHAQQASASTQDALQNKAFRQLEDANELRRMEALCEQLARRIRKRLLRRQQQCTHGRQLNLRDTLRQSLRYGGEPMSLAWRKRKQQTPKLVVLLDVSRSMSVYSYLFLRFARGIIAAFVQADAFAFHTRLQHIGDTLREPNRRKLAEKMALISAGFAGGTRIDKSLQTFNRQYAHKILGSSSTVIILSDGYDTGEPALLQKQIKCIKQRARKLIWLNPLLGQQNYEPKTRCMQAVLPMLDVFAPAHNLASLAALEQHLSM